VKKLSEACKSPIRLLPTRYSIMSMSIEELDATVRAFYEGRGDQQKQAQTALNQFKENPDTWLMVDKILQDATYEQTKYLGLQVLDNVIMTRWKVLPREQCQGRPSKSSFPGSRTILK